MGKILVKLSKEIELYGNRAYYKKNTWSTMFQTI